MTTKHTTAPWVLHNLSGEIRTQDNLKVITDINYRLRDGCGEANAKLIAAAPDLLEALIAAIDFIDKNVEGHVFGIDKMRAVIAKATQ